MTCVHHWVLGDPVQGVSAGQCRKCGERREFSGAFDDWGQRPIVVATERPDRHTLADER